MEVQFYGVRGSIPTPPSNGILREKVIDVLEKATPEDLQDDRSRESLVDEHFLPYAGGNSSCVRVHAEESPIIICDAGSGIRPAGLDIMGEEGKEICIFISHTHWDHIMGFPFFVPAYAKGYNIKVFGCHPEMEKRFQYQQTDTHFPITLDMMASNIEFVQMKPGESVLVGETKVTPVAQEHPGDSFSYVFENKGKKLIYATDSSYEYLGEMKTGENLYTGADAFIFDAMYSFGDYIDRLDWGHSSSLFGADFCASEDIKRLVLFHHEPQYDDKTLSKLARKTKKHIKNNHPDVEVEVVLAVEGERLRL